MIYYIMGHFQYNKKHDVWSGIFEYLTRVVASPYFLFEHVDFY